MPSNIQQIFKQQVYESLESKTLVSYQGFLKKKKEKFRSKLFLFLKWTFKMLKPASSHLLTSCVTHSFIP